MYWLNGSSYKICRLILSRHFVTASCQPSDGTRKLIQLLGLCLVAGGKKLIPTMLHNTSMTQKSQVIVVVVLLLKDLPCQSQNPRLH